MAGLTDRDRELVAIGAAIGSNCVPCVAFHVGQARRAGLADEEIELAVALAEEIRLVPANLVVKAARAHLGADSRNVPEVGDEGTRSCCS